MLFILHSLIGALNVPIAASVLRYSILLSVQQFYLSMAVSAGNQMHWILVQTPYFLAKILIGLLLGFQMGRHYRNRVMIWTWIVPALSIAWSLLFAPLAASDYLWG